MSLARAIFFARYERDAREVPPKRCAKCRPPPRVYDASEVTVIVAGIKCETLEAFDAVIQWARD